jgi:phage-related tail fiber protein
MIMSGNFIPNFMVSGSIDNIINHVATTRFQSGSLTAATFQNVTNINSTLIFCRASADEFNYSSNPTFRDASGNIVVIDAGDDTGQRSFSFITTVGLYNSNNDLLAVAKLSRPIEKNDEKDLTIRVRLDF